MRRENQKQNRHNKERGKSEAKNTEEIYWKHKYRLANNCFLQSEQ